MHTVKAAKPESIRQPAQRRRKKRQRPDFDAPVFRLSALARVIRTQAAKKERPQNRCRPGFSAGNPRRIRRGFSEHQRRIAPGSKALRASIQKSGIRVSRTGWNILSLSLPFYADADFKCARLACKTFVIMARGIKILFSEEISHTQCKNPIIATAEL